MPSGGNIAKLGAVIHPAFFLRRTLGALGLGFLALAASLLRGQDIQIPIDPPIIFPPQLSEFPVQFGESWRLWKGLA